MYTVYIPEPNFQTKSISIMSYFYTHQYNILPLDLCAALRTYFDESPSSAHLGMRQEGENMHLPSMRLDITDKRAKKITKLPLRTLVHEAVTASGVLKQFFSPNTYRFKRFTVRRYSKADRDGCNWHVDGSDLAVVIFCGGTCVDSESGGDLVMGEGETPDRILKRVDQTEGSMAVFQGCEISHMVTPVTKGTRYTVVLFLNVKHERKCNSK